MIRAGVVGHVEWVDFAVVERLPEPGEILHAREHFSEAAGGGAVAAVQMRRLLGAASFWTAVGDDVHGRLAVERLRDVHGVELHAAVRPREQRRALTYLDAAHERTITVLGPRLVPHGDDPLPWDALAGLDAVYVTGGDVAAIRFARAARVVVATPRALPALAEAGIEIDALVGSATDPGEQVAGDALDPPPALAVRTRGAAGGEWSARDGRTGTWEASTPPGPEVDTYGAGDSFAAALAVALGEGRELGDALAFAARAGAACVTGRGPYGAGL